MTKPVFYIVTLAVALLASACTRTETTYYPDGRTQSVITTPSNPHSVRR